MAGQDDRHAGMADNRTILRKGWEETADDCGWDSLKFYRVLVGRAGGSPEVCTSNGVRTDNCGVTDVAARRSGSSTRVRWIERCKEVTERNLMALQYVGLSDECGGHALVPAACFLLWNSVAVH